MQGSSVIVRVDFDAVPLSMSMLHWQARQDAWLKVLFPGSVHLSVSLFLPGFP
jgi:hypothetical protein